MNYTRLSAQGERLATNQFVGSATPVRFDPSKFTCHGGIHV
jgi:hypothetical protein